MATYQELHDIFSDSVRHQKLLDRLQGGIITYSYTVASAASGTYPAAVVVWAKTVNVESFATQAIGLLKSNYEVAQQPDADLIVDGSIAWILQNVIVPLYVGV